MNKPPITAVIIDDEQEAVNDLLVLLNGMEDVAVVGSATNPEKAISLCLKTLPDIVFFDIQMPELVGFGVLETLLSYEICPYTIFTTAHESYSLRTKKEGAFDYIQKPIDRVELEAGIAEAIANMETYSIKQRIRSIEKVLKSHRGNLIN